MKKIRRHFFSFLRANPFLIKLFKLVPLFLLLLAIFILGTKSYAFLKSKGVSLSDLSQINQDPQDFLDSTADQTNFLILGIRGEGYDSPNLSDTIMILSYDHRNQTIKMITIPRDLWIDPLKTKINAVYHYGQEKDPVKGGIVLMQTSIQQVLDIPIHYTIVVNFTAFRQIIDSLGGVQVQVQNEFTDNKFPIPGKENIYPIEDRYETIYFPQGTQTMDGTTALKFVRSRNAQGQEGTDFARSRRQQQVISAIKAKIFDNNIFLNKTKMQEILNIIEQNVQTNIPPDVYPSLVKLALKNRANQISNINLSSEDKDGEIPILQMVRLDQYDNQWVLVARDNNWQALKDYLHNKLDNTQ